MTTPDLRAIEGRLLRIAAEMVRLTGVCESGHKPGQEHIHAEAFHDYGRAVATEVNALRAALASQPEPLDAAPCWFCKTLVPVEALIAGYDTFDEARLACLACNVRWLENASDWSALIRGYRAAIGQAEEPR